MNSVCKESVYLYLLGFLAMNLKIVFVQLTEHPKDRTGVVYETRLNKEQKRTTLAVCEHMSKTFHKDPLGSRLGHPPGVIRHPEESGVLRRTFTSDNKDHTHVSTGLQ